jgi:lysozyme family protein
MTEEFKKIYDHTLKWEGGSKLHNVSGDSGGWTIYGISYNNNKQHFNSLEDFKKMTYEKACEIAYNNYYKPLHLEKVNPEVRDQLFDIAFNTGVKRAVILVQRALGLIDDGIMGKITLGCLPDLKNDRLYNERVKFYNSIVKNNPSQNKFLKGWLNRSNDFI